MSAATSLSPEWISQIESRLKALEYRIGYSRAAKEAVRWNRKDVVLKVVSEFFGMPVSEITSRKQNAAVVFPRNLAMYLLYCEEGFSYPEVGRVFLKHHTTVLHSLEKISAVRHVDEAVEKIIQELRARLAEAA